MAAISNLISLPSNSGIGKTQTSTPATGKPKSIFDLLGVTPGMGVGGKPLFPSTTEPSTSVAGP